MSELAYNLFMEKKYNECIQECEKVLQHSDSNIDALILLSTVYLQKDEFKVSLEYAKRAHEIKISAETWLQLCAVYTELRETEKALSAVEEALKIDPVNYSHYHMKSVCLITLGRLDEAELASRKMKELFDQKYPNNLPSFTYETLSEHYRGLGLIYLVRKKYQASLSNVESGLSLNPKDPLLILIKGYLKLHERKNSEALNYFNQANEIGLKIPEVFRGIGFANLYMKEFKLAIEAFEKAFKMDSQDITTAIGLYDAYLMNGQIIKADKLVKNCQISEFSSSTTESPILFKQMRPTSYVVVYIWNPKHDTSSRHHDIDYGHAAIKVVCNGKSFYFSWFPSGDNYINQNGIPRSTPATYGKKNTINTDEKAKAKIMTLFGDPPPNLEAQVKQILMRKSDKEEFKKSAAFKFFFTKGINIDRLLTWWKELLKSEKAYQENSYNCCDVVLHSLQFALDEKIKNITSIKTSRLRDNIYYDKNSILNGHRYEISPQSGSKSPTIYQYCYLLAKQINSELNHDVPPVIVRYNRWNKSLRSLTKFDFDPSKFNPNWMVRTKKMNNEQIYLNLINSSFSEVLFADVGNIEAEENKNNINIKLESNSTALTTELGDSHYLLIKRIQPIINNNNHYNIFLKLINEGKYNQALRTACKACKNKDKEIYKLIDILLDFDNSISISITINELNSEGNAAIHYAALNGNRDLYDLLILRGADAKLTNKDGKDAISILKEKEAETNADNKKLELSDTNLSWPKP